MFGQEKGIYTLKLFTPSGEVKVVEIEIDDSYTELRDTGYGSISYQLKSFLMYYHGRVIEYYNVLTGCREQTSLPYILTRKYS